MSIVYKSILGLGLLSMSIPALAQNEIDALRFGQTNITGTARSLGVSNAMGAVGGDMSAISINPAGIGVYRSSELMFTPTIKFGNNNSTYLNTTNNRGFSRFSINNFGVVFSNPARGKDYEKSAWKSVSFGLTYNKLQDFNEEGRYYGNNSESSITEVFGADAMAYGTDLNMVPPFGGFGYEGYLIDDNYNSYVYNNILLNGGSVNQEKYWKSRGNIQEWSFTFGGNYQEKLLIGASLNLLSYRYNATRSYYEEDASLDINDFDNLTYNEYLNSLGTGFNAKFGLLYNINKDFRIGGHVNTPTWIALSDESDYEIMTETENLKYDLGAGGGSQTIVRPPNPSVYDYSLRTPFKVGINAMAYLGNKGFVDVDYEYAAYSTMRYNFPGYQNSADNINNEIQNTFRGAHNIRAGIEGRFDNLFARAGIAHQTSPYQDSKTFGGSRTSFSLGGGVNMKSFSLNLAYTFSMYSYSEYGYPIIYSGIPVGLADINQNNNLIALSLGFKL